MRTTRLITVCICLYLILGNLNAQESGTIFSKKTYFSFGAGYGYINPEDINSTLDTYVEDNGITFTKGNSNINLVLILESHLSHFINENVEIKGGFEFGMGYKEIKYGVFGSSTFNTLIRLSPQLMANYHHMLKNELSDVYVGGGLNYNKLILDAFNGDISGKGSALGLSFQLGFSMKTARKAISYIEIQGNIIKGDNDETNTSWGWGSVYVKELSFSGIAIKFGIKF